MPPSPESEGSRTLRAVRVGAGDDCTADVQYRPVVSDHKFVLCYLCDIHYDNMRERHSAWDTLMSMDGRIKIASAEREHVIGELA